MSAIISWIRYISIHWKIKLLIACFLFIGISSHVLAVEEIKRRVLVLYDSSSGQGAMSNPVYESAQMVLNYLGMLTEYYDIHERNFPEADKIRPYRAIITAFNSERMKDPSRYLSWLIQQAERGKKIVIFGYTGVKESLSDEKVKELFRRLFLKLGLKYVGNETRNMSITRYLFKDPKGVEFERRYPTLAPEYSGFKPVSKELHKYLIIGREDIQNSGSPMIVTGPNGGYAHQEYIIWEDPGTGRKQWYLNPFMFFKEALSINRIPVPDPTTLNGLRVGFSHIDADGFSGPSRIDNRFMCSEIIRDRILKKYDFPVTASVIVGEIDPDANGSVRCIRVARSIFALPNVEPASHSYSHPFFWDPDDPERFKYKHQYGIIIPGYNFDPQIEIDYSIKYITKNLSPPGKRCKVMLWSGNCKPTESDIARCDALGVLNMNGGDTVFDELDNSYTSVAPIYRQVGTRYQIHTGQANDNILTNLWSPPYSGFRRIITTMKRTDYPRRVAPLDIYYHFFSGEWMASLKALEEVYTWALKQNLAKVFTSDYIKMVRGYLRAKLFRIDQNNFLVKDYKDCLTIRFDDRDLVVDILNSKNILGYVKEPQGLYVHLLPDSDEALISLKTKEDELKYWPYIIRATGWIRRFEMSDNRISIVFKTFNKGWIEIGGLLPQQAFYVSGSALDNSPLKLVSDSKGVLSISHIKSGTLVISWK